MHDWLEQLVDQVHLAHPLKVKAIADAKIKTDKIDVQVLAHLLHSDLLPEAYVPAPATGGTRNVLRQRMFFVRVRTMIKNRIWNLLGRYPKLASSSPCQELFSKQGLAWLKAVPLKEQDREMLNEELKLYHALEERISQSEELVQKLTKQGNKYLRWALVEAIWPAVRSAPDLGAYYQKVKARKGANRAKIATARRLATIDIECTQLDMHCAFIGGTK